jgi:hypothetical protein
MQAEMAEVADGEEGGAGKPDEEDMAASASQAKVRGWAGTLVVLT